MNFITLNNFEFKKNIYIYKYERKDEKKMKRNSP